MNFLVNIYNKWCELDDKIRFLFIGGINTVFSYLIFVVCILFLGKEHHQLCVALQWVLSSVFSFLNQKFFVFCTRGNYIKEYLKCCSTWAIGYFLNAILIELFIKIYDNVFVVQPIIILIVSIFTYVVFKYFAFKK